ncbi:MAG: hypothetical protein K6E85_13270 [Lachnospiraceae bacterium]|nr:hypothetical protein [Lachnospiraceae bacterium]
MKKRILAVLLSIATLMFGFSSPVNTWAADKVAAPLGVTVKSNKSGNPVISWKEVENAVEYRVYRKTENDSSWIKIKTTTKLKVTDTKWVADTGTTIQYVVKSSVKKDDKKVWSKNSKTAKWTVPSKEIEKSKAGTSEKVDKSEKSGTKYVLNTNTHKIHYPSCRDVDKIKPENYATTDESINDLKKQGYSTCGHCNPR